MKTHILLCFTLLVCVSATAQVRDDDLVASAFPPDLVEPDGLRQFEFVTADLNRDGHPLLVAVYSNGGRAAVRVLNRAGQVLSAPDLRGMKAFHATISTVDVDGDGVPEIFVQTTGGHGLGNPESWLFRWSSNHLQLISPTCAAHDLSFTCLGDVTFLDVDGSGKLSILSWPAFHLDADSGGVRPDGPWRMYAQKDETFQQQPGTFVFARQFRRGSGSPLTSSRHFTASAGPASLRVVNGSGKAATDSGHIFLNDVEVVSPADFKRSERAFVVPVMLKQANTISVRLDGKPGAVIEVLFESSVSQ